MDEKRVEPLGDRMILPAGQVTFLLTGIEGSTRAWERYPEAMPQALGAGAVGGCVGREHRSSELVTGAVVAGVLAAVTFPFAFVIAGESSVAWTVVLAVLASCATATVRGIALPRILAGIGQDPAFASGPLVTIVQDLPSIAVYLGLAVALV